MMTPEERYEMHRLTKKLRKEIKKYRKELAHECAPCTRAHVSYYQYTPTVTTAGTSDWKPDTTRTIS